MKKNTPPSMDAWLAEAKQHPDAAKIGMYLFHDGVVREDAKAKVRTGATDTQPVTGMQFSFDAAKLEAVIQETYSRSNQKRMCDRNRALLTTMTTTRRNRGHFFIVRNRRSLQNITYQAHAAQDR